MGDAGEKHERRVGGSGGIQPHNGRAHGHTSHTCMSFRAAAHLARAAVPARGEAGGGDDGGRDDARASARRAEAAGALRCARGGAYMRGSSYGGQRAASGVGQQGPEFELAAAAHLEGLVQKLLLRCSFIWGRRAPILANHQPQPAQNAAATAGVQKTSRISTCQGVHGAQTRASQSSCMSNLRPTYEACGCSTLCKAAHLYLYLYPVVRHPRLKAPLPC